MNTYNDYIVTDYRVMLGKPILKGTRLTVELILRKLSEGASHTDMLEMYPHLSEAHLLAVLAYAADVLANEESLLSVSLWRI